MIDDNYHPTRQPVLLPAAGLVGQAVALIVLHLAPFEHLETILAEERLAFETINGTPMNPALLHLKIDSHNDWCPPMPYFLEAAANRSPHARPTPQFVAVEPGMFVKPAFSRKLPRS